MGNSVIPIISPFSKKIPEKLEAPFILACLYWYNTHGAE